MEMFLGWCEKDTSPLKLSPSSKALQRQTTKETAYILLRHVDIVMFRICMSHKWLNSNMMLHTHTAVVGGRRSRATFVALEQQEQRSVVMVMKEGPRHWGAICSAQTSAINSSHTAVHAALMPLSPLTHVDHDLIISCMSSSFMQFCVCIYVWWKYQVPCVVNDIDICPLASPPPQPSLCCYSRLP